MWMKDWFQRRPEKSSRYEIDFLVNLGNNRALNYLLSMLLFIFHNKQPEPQTFSFPLLTVTSQTPENINMMARPFNGVNMSSPRLMPYCPCMGH